jgi:hypothetical protein
MGEEEIIIFFILFLIGILLFHSMKKLSYFMLYSIKVNELKGLKINLLYNDLFFYQNGGF